MLCVLIGSSVICICCDWPDIIYFLNSRKKTFLNDCENFDLKHSTCFNIQHLRTDATDCMRVLSKIFPPLKRFSTECRETKIKAITMTNNNRRNQHNKPMRTQRKYT